MSAARFPLVIAILCGVAVSTVAGVGHAGPKWSVGRNVATSAQVPMDQIDHPPWTSLLEKYVDANGNVDYAAWQQSAADVQALDAYLAELSTASTQSRSRSEARIAFWINAYNAVTIKGILREHPTSSIRNHTARLYGYNIWHDLLLIVGGRQYSLHQIEHEILRKSGEPRIHFAIVCASKSCPKLRREAYTADRLQQQLTANTREFFSLPQNFRYDANAQRFYLSAILSWFAKDFGVDQAAQLRYYAPYLPTRDASQAAINNSVRISHLNYDWALNDQGPPASAKRPSKAR